MKNINKKIKKKETIYIIQIMILLLCSLYYYKKNNIKFPRQNILIKNNKDKL